MGEPVFGEAWEAQAFAMAMLLNERGVFSRSEWTQALGAEIAAAGPDTERTYYELWLSALEKLVTRKSLIGEHERQERIEAWDCAARRTPHGQPIVLQPSDVNPGKASRIQ
jgi:nitrile hydratase accessory protein